jgi:hypothetical protein
MITAMRACRTAPWALSILSLSAAAGAQGSPPATEPEPRAVEDRPAPHVAYPESRTSGYRGGLFFAGDEAGTYRVHVQGRAHIDS